MRAEPNLSEKLQAIDRDVAQRGIVEITCLTVLKKWLEVPGRLDAFALFIARRAISKARGRGLAADLIRETRRFMKSAGSRSPGWGRTRSAWALCDRLRDYQNEYQRQRWGPVRIIRNMDLFLVEEALAIRLGLEQTPSDGYRLAAKFCEEYDPRYGTGLLRESRPRFRAIARFVAAQDAGREVGGGGAGPA